MANDLFVLELDDVDVYDLSFQEVRNNQFVEGDFW